MPSVMARLKVEPEPVPRQPVALPVSPLPAKAGAPSRAQSKGRQASSTPTKVLKGSLDTSKGLQSSWAQSEAEAGPSKASKTVQPEVGALPSQMPTVSALTVNLLLWAQDQAFTHPHTCTAPSPPLLRLKSSTASICCSVGRIRRSHLPTPAQPPLPHLLRLKSSSVSICCSGGRIRCSHFPTHSQPPSLTFAG